MDFFDEYYYSKEFIDSKQMDHWMQSLESECKQMRNFLKDHVSDQATFDELKDQLSWLKFQMDFYERTGNIYNLIDDFNWVVSNFNKDLHLADNQRFPYIPSPKKE